jgi:hypothetical protein
MTFWNKVQQGVKSAAAEAEKQARSARLGMQIGDVESNIRQKTRDLGESALALIREGKLTEPTFDGIVAEIAQLEARLAELRAEQAEIQSATPGPPAP